MRHFAFIDITSAYDDVFLDVLCDTLYNINLPCKLIQMVCVLLTKRTLYFYINGILRETRAMYKGLGQDTFLSPLLYNTYTSHIEKITSPDVRIIKYVDDVTIYSIVSDGSILQQKNLETARDTHVY